MFGLLEDESLNDDDDVKECPGLVKLCLSFFLFPFDQRRSGLLVTFRK
jgi:hypothetical protein